jgi:hypothetical protein
MALPGMMVIRRRLSKGKDDAFGDYLATTAPAEYALQAMILEILH